MVPALARAAVLFLPILVPYAGVVLVFVVAVSPFVVPDGRGIADRLAGTAVVDAPAPATGWHRHRFPRRAIGPLPLPGVTKTALVELGVPAEVPGLFRVDPRMTVFDEVLFSIGTDPAGMALCVVSPGGEVVAVDPGAARPNRFAGATLPAFLELLDAAAEAGSTGARGAIRAADADALDDPDSWWRDVL
jgi:hypothetical protein